MGHQVLGVGITGPQLTELERRILRESPPYAVVLFARNVESVEQLQSLVRELKSQSDQPPLVMMDQEGGRVDRLRMLVSGLPSAEAFEEGNDAERLAGWSGRVIGSLLRFFDIDVNLAPVLDLRSEPPALGLERRCWGSDAESVIALGGAFMRGLHDAGVASCLKHFPGIGAGTGDSHYQASVIDLDIEEMRANDLRPFEELAADSGAIMIGHGLYPRLSDDAIPASLNRRIAHDLLREDLKFDGLAISDDMEMHAVSDLGRYEEICERALTAGNDIILMCSHVEMAPDIMAHLERRGTEDGAISVRLDEAIARGAEYRAHCGRLRGSAMLEPGTFDELLDEVERFRQAFDEAQPDGDATARRDRRKTPRTPGTGRTGREEWT